MATICCTQSNIIQPLPQSQADIDLQIYQTFMGRYVVFELDAKFVKVCFVNTQSNASDLTDPEKKQITAACKKRYGLLEVKFIACDTVVVTKRDSTKLSGLFVFYFVLHRLFYAGIPWQTFNEKCITNHSNGMFKMGEILNSNKIPETFSFKQSKTPSGRITGNCFFYSNVFI